jgi:cytochrome c peroxidase
MLNLILNRIKERFLHLKTVTSISVLGAVTIFSITAQATLIVETPSPPPSLAKLSRPEPSNLSSLVSDKKEAIALGKALFWEMRVGSDGKQACASCHFSAGADPRFKNQLSPGQNGTSFAFGGPNYTLKASDFPFVKFSNPNKHYSTLERDNRIATSSQGVFNTSFNAVTAGYEEDVVNVVYDSLFNVNGINTRRVEPRNTPTVINAVFNFRNFWDGRAQNTFNGVSVWGNRDKNAMVYKSPLSINSLNLPNKPYAYNLAMSESSLASQAVGPVISDFEMSAHGRNFPDLGHKLLSMRALANQKVASDDSVLASYRDTTGTGLNKTYADMIKKAFKPEWWNGNQPVTLQGKNYSHMEANFSLYFGLAVQLYEATLVSDQSPYDKYAEGLYSELTAQQQAGFGIFMGKGNCIACHNGANFSSASFEHKFSSSERMSRMLMGDGKQAVYDEGFYNIGVTRTADDVGVGGKDPWGKPLSFSALSKLDNGLSLLLAEKESGNLVVSSSERVAVQGSFKVPTLRNVALTAPYFHNGSAGNLMQVVEFYNRGGNFPHHNINDLDADIQPLGLSQSEKEALVAFLESLTDPRVTNHAAPFDHPELIVPNGQNGDEKYCNDDGKGRAEETDSLFRVPEIGASGYSSQLIKAFNDYLGLSHYTHTPNNAPSPEPALLSKGKPATQSSTDGSASASRAVDGNIDGLWSKNSVTHTRYSAQPWWQVDLGKASKITKVEIYNRTDCCWTNLSNFVVAISPNDMTGLSVAQLKADPNVKWVSIGSVQAKGSYHFDEVDGRYVRIMLEGSNYLMLAEVQVYGY